MTAVVQNAASARQVRKGSKKEQQLRLQELADVRWVLSTTQGRRFFWRYLSDCGVFTTSFTGNSTTFYNEGMRNVGLKLMADVQEAQPEAYLQMVKEHQATDEAEDAAPVEEKKEPEEET